jgi:hypothetical protein
MKELRLTNLETVNGILMHIANLSCYLLQIRDPDTPRKLGAPHIFSNRTAIATRNCRL